MRGSSPHTRDKHNRNANNATTPRIIPAYAGQTLLSLSQLLLFQDHPRIRGTNKSTLLLFSCASGSSPHTRDKRETYIRWWLYNRIIPAYAGQTVFLLPIKVWNQDHPRIRGTNTKRSPKIKSPTADFDKIHSLLLPIHKSI